MFEKQVELACKLGKPLFLHERDAHTQMVHILQNNIDRYYIDIDIQFKSVFNAAVQLRLSLCLSQGFIDSSLFEKVWCLIAGSIINL